MRTVDFAKLLEDLQKIADLTIYNCDYAGPGRVTISSKIVDYFQSDDFAAVGMLQRGEAQTEEVSELIQQTRSQDAEIRALKQKIIKLEETEGLYRVVCAQNARLLERIEDLKK